MLVQWYYLFQIASLSSIHFVSVSNKSQAIGIHFIHLRENILLFVEKAVNINSLRQYQVKGWKLYWTAGLFYTSFFRLCVGDLFLKPRVEPCFRELKMAATSEGFATNEFDIRTYLCLLPSYLQRMTCT